jgi:NAD(P)-dependent dehydrogenase (short-subunit alcohol dehydrogenase family)
MALNGRVVAISGAAGGLGPTVARAFAGAGATLAVAGREGARLGALLDSLELPPARRLATVVDLADPMAAQGWAREVVEKLGRVDVVIHLVGGYRGGTGIGGIPPEDWRFIAEALVTTTLNVARAFVGPLKANGWGRFLTVSSPFARKPTSKKAVYAMGKAATDALILALADELAGTGATANAVAATSILTPEGRAAAPDKPIGKAALAEEIAAAMLYLCTDEAGAINGAIIPLTARG